MAEGVYGCGVKMCKWKWRKCFNAYAWLTKILVFILHKIPSEKHYRI